MAIEECLSLEKPPSGAPEGVAEAAALADVDSMIASITETVDALDSGTALKLLANMRAPLDGIELSVLSRSYAGSRQVSVLLRQAPNMSTRDAANRARRGEAAEQLTNVLTDLTNGTDLAHQTSDPRRNHSLPPQTAVHPT